jgi:LuxR family maltose regulon positive regulatory protein
MPQGDGARGSPASLVERQRVAAGKLSVPPLREGIVERPQLVETLLSSRDQPVVLVSAPAGYGKTTLLALWRRRDERPFAWVSLEAADNDAVRLVGCVLAALQTIVPVNPALRDALGDPEPDLEGTVLPAIVDACAAAHSSFVLVLDDLHLVTDRRCHAAVGYLADRFPQGSQLALATRTDPSLPLASLRAHGRLVELRASELALVEAEGRALLTAAGVEVTDAQAARLMERTEGWPAALYLAALSLRDRPQRDHFVDHFAGTTRHVADFLSEDVLARQPDDLIDFLLRSCVVDELTASLCAVLTDRADPQAALRDLERSNLFLVPLDEERHAYRYHHLFVQYLRAELARRAPGLVPDLHRRASGWYRSHGLTGKAIAHALAAGDISCAAELVSAAWLPMVENGQVETMRSWIAGFTVEQIAAHAPLAIAAAWVAALAGNGERAAWLTKTARSGSWDGPMPDGTASLESALAIMTSAFGLGGLSAMRTAAQRAVELEQAHGEWRALALLLLGVAETLLGDLTAGIVALEEAVALSGGETSTGATSLAYLALIELREGHETEASRHAQRAQRVVERPGMRNYLPNICTYAVLAHLAARRGDPCAASLAIERVYAPMQRLTAAFWWQLIVTRLLLAPALTTLGREEDAATLLDEVGELLRMHTDTGTLPAWHTEAVAALRAPRRAPATQDLSRAERRILRLLDSDLSLSEIGRQLYLSANTVKTHKRAIYRKLGVSSREAAVRAARKIDSPG